MLKVWNHWLSDVFVSTVIGIIIGKVSYNLNKHRLVIK